MELKRYGIQFSQHHPIIWAVNIEDYASTFDSDFNYFESPVEAAKGFMRRALDVGELDNSNYDVMFPTQVRIIEYGTKQEDFEVPKEYDVILEPVAKIEFEMAFIVPNL